MITLLMYLWEEILMKKTAIIMLVLLLTIPMLGFSQQQTLIKGKLTHGGFAGPVLKYSQMLDQDALLVGLRGGWIIGRSLYIGGAGYGLVNRVESFSQYAGTDTAVVRYLGLGYGGLELGVILASDRIIDVASQVLFGAGGALHTNRDNWEDFEWDMDEHDGDAFFILEPAIDIELNVTSFFRICIGASYRFVTGIEMDEFKNSDLNGFSGVFTLKFGRF